MKETKGITLIALVITIVVLIILAGVLINLTLGDNGLFSKSKLAKQKYEYAEAKEIVDLKLVDIHAECMIEGKEYTLKKISEEMTAEQNITIVAKYFKSTSLKKDNVSESNVDLKGIVVSANVHPEYEFLIGEKGETVGLIGVTTDELPETWEESDFIAGKVPEEFLSPEQFEIQKLGSVVSTNTNNSNNNNNNNNNNNQPVDTRSYIYNQGSISQEAEEMIGGYDTNAFYQIKSNSLFMSITGEQHHTGAAFRTKNKIDLSDYTKIKCLISAAEFTDWNPGGFIIGLSDDIPTNIYYDSRDYDYYSDMYIGPGKDNYVVEYYIPEECRNNNYYVWVNSDMPDVYVYKIWMEDTKSYIYNEGNISYEAEEMYGLSDTNSSYVFNASSIKCDISNKSYNASFIGTNNKINIDNYSTIKCLVSTGTLSNYTPDGLGFSLLETKQEDIATIQHVTPSNQRIGMNQELVVLEQSLSEFEEDEYYVGIISDMPDTYIYKIWLE